MSPFSFSKQIDIYITGTNQPLGNRFLRSLLKLKKDSIMLQFHTEGKVNGLNIVRNLFAFSEEDVASFFEKIHPKELMALHTAQAKHNLVLLFDNDKTPETKGAFNVMEDGRPMIAVTCAGSRLAGKQAVVWHELTHMEQWVRGDLTPHEGTLLWKGQCMKAIDYRARECEIEAFGAQFDFERENGMTFSFLPNKLMDLRFSLNCTFN